MGSFIHDLSQDRRIGTIKAHRRLPSLFADQNWIIPTNHQFGRRVAREIGSKTRPRSKALLCHVGGYLQLAPFSQRYLFHVDRGCQDTLEAAKPESSGTPVDL